MKKKGDSLTFIYDSYNSYNFLQILTIVSLESPHYDKILQDFSTSHFIKIAPTCIAI